MASLLLPLLTASLSWSAPDNPHPLLDPVWDVEGHSILLVDQPPSCCLSSWRLVSVDVGRGRNRILVRAASDEPDSLRLLRGRTRSLLSRAGKGLRELVPAHPDSGPDGRKLFRLGPLWDQGLVSGPESTSWIPRKVPRLPLPSACCDGGLGGPGRCEVPASPERFWWEPWSRRFLVAWEIHGAADGCDAGPVYTLEPEDDRWPPLSRDPLVALLEGGAAALGSGTLWLVTAPVEGGGYPWPYLGAFALASGRERAHLDLGWGRAPGEEPPVDSVRSWREKALGVLGSERAQVVPRKGHLFEAGRGASRRLWVRQGDSCWVVGAAPRIPVARACCDPEGSGRVGRCLRPSNRWRLWPLPGPGRGFLEAWTESVSNDCAGGPTRMPVDLRPSGCPEIPPDEP